MSGWPRVAMIFAAGRGERMRPLSDVLPKPALPLPGGPVVGWALRLAARHGVTRIAANTWHLAMRMEAALNDARPGGIELAVSREHELLGTAGGLAAARDRGLLGAEGPVLVINGDGVLGLDLGPLFERHAAHDDLVTLALLPHLDPRRWSRIALDAAGRIVDIRRPGEPAPGEVPLLYPGVMVVARSALEMLPASVGGVADALWEPARAVGRLGGVVVGGHWREVGTPSEYLEAAMAHLADRSVVSASACVHPSATVRASLVGDRTVVEAGAVVERSVAADGVVIRAGGRVRRSILLGAVTVEPDEAVDGAVRACP